MIEQEALDFLIDQVADGLGLEKDEPVFGIEVEFAVDAGTEFIIVNVEELPQLYKLRNTPEQEAARLRGLVIEHFASQKAAEAKVEAMLEENQRLAKHLQGVEAQVSEQQERLAVQTRQLWDLQEENWLQATIIEAVNNANLH